MTIKSTYLSTQKKKVKTYPKDVLLAYNNDQ